MLNTHYRFLLFLVIIIEGYIVLSTELLAIRQSIPFVGSGTDTVSVIIAAVLMPLAFGYQAGGNFKIKRLFGKRITVRRKLIINITIAALILLPGLSYQFMLMFFSFLSSLEITNRIHQISIYSILFLEQFGLEMEHVHSNPPWRMILHSASIRLTILMRCA